MRRITLLICLPLLTLPFANRALAQDVPKPAETAKPAEPTAHYYHFDFSIQELSADGKPTNSRAYSTTVSTDLRSRSGSIRTGSRIPVVTGALRGPTETGDSKLEYQYQYLDVGVNIDTSEVHEIGRQVAFNLKAEISSLADHAPSSVSGLLNDPVLRQNSWQASVIIPIGKPTVVFSSEALDSKGSMQLVVTATPLQ